MRPLTACSQRKTDRLIYTSRFVHVNSRIVLIRPGTVTMSENKKNVIVNVMGVFANGLSEM